MFLVNSRSHLVTAASKSVNLWRRTFSRSYGTILPSSFTQVLSSALEYSSRPPVSVWGTAINVGAISWNSFTAQYNPISLCNLRNPSTSNWLRNINLISIDYAFRPRLRCRLTLRRLTLRRNPWAFGVGVFHPHYRYSCQHSHF